METSGATSDMRKGSAVEHCCNPTAKSSLAHLALSSNQRMRTRTCSSAKTGMSASPASSAAEFVAEINAVMTRTRSVATATVCHARHALCAVERGADRSGLSAARGESRNVRQVSTAARKVAVAMMTLNSAAKDRGDHPRAVKSVQKSAVTVCANRIAHSAAGTTAAISPKEKSAVRPQMVRRGVVRATKLAVRRPASAWRTARFAAETHAATRRRMNSAVPALMVANRVAWRETDAAMASASRIAINAAAMTVVATTRNAVMINANHPAVGAAKTATLSTIAHKTPVAACLQLAISLVAQTASRCVATECVSPAAIRAAGMIAAIPRLAKHVALLPTAANRAAHPTKHAVRKAGSAFPIVTSAAETTAAPKMKRAAAVHA